MVRFTVRRRIILLLVIVSLVPLAVANSIWLLSSQAELRSAAASQQKLQVVSSADAVSNFIDDKVNAAIIHSQTTGVQNMQLNEALPELSTYLNQDSDLNTVSLVDAGGTQRLMISRSGLAMKPVNVSTSDAFRVVTFLGGEDYISPVSFDARHQGYITIGVPLVNYSATQNGSSLSTSEPGVILPPTAIRGALIVQVALAHLWSTVLATSLGHSGYAYVVDDQGNLIAYPAAKFAQSHTSLDRIPEVASALAQAPIVPGATPPAPVPRQTISETGVQVLASFSRVARTGWIVVAEEPIKSVYAPVNNDVRVAAGFFALSCLVGLLLILLLARNLLEPIRRLTDGAERLAKGDLGFRLAVPRRDEFGLLAETFNIMAGKIQADIATLRGADEIKNEFIFIASHNLRTPLTLINSYIELIKESRLPPKTKTMLKGIQGSAHELSRFSEDMLTISTIESGYAVLDIVSITVGELLKPVRLEGDSMASKKDVHMEWMLPDPSARVRLSPVHIRSALTNLLSNAIEFTPAGGRVGLEMGVTTDACVITVRDTGSGIDPDEMEKLFTKFHRGTDTLRYEHPGTGIGLYVTGLVVEAHRGHITVSSQVGRGSTFTVTLPATTQVVDLDDPVPE